MLTRVMYDIKFNKMKSLVLVFYDHLQMNHFQLDRPEGSTVNLDSIIKSLILVAALVFSQSLSSVLFFIEILIFVYFST